MQWMNLWGILGRTFETEVHPLRQISGLFARYMGCLGLGRGCGRSNVAPQFQYLVKST
jgi:hypothetical protein